jgi:hypothetical protein
VAKEAHSFRIAEHCGRVVRAQVSLQASDGSGFCLAELFQSMVSSHYDQDNDNVISFEEFCEFLTRAHPLHPGVH